MPARPSWSRQRRALVAFVVVAVSVIGASCARETSSPRESLTQYSKRVALRLEARVCGGLDIGTGFRISKHLILTNRHVVAAAMSLTVTDYRHHVRRAVVADVASTADLALVRVGAPLSAPVMHFATHNPQSGDKVTIVGFPQGGRVRAVDGRVVDYLAGAKADEPGRVMRSSTEAEPGNSGGPLVTADRRAGGIVFALDLIDNYALVIPQATVRTTLRRLDSSAQRAWTTCSTGP